MKIKLISIFISIFLLSGSAVATTKSSFAHKSPKENIPTSNIVATPVALAVDDTNTTTYYHAPFVFASPYLSGAKSAYNASDLITNWSSINEDLAILQAQKKHANALEAAGMSYPDRPIIAVSGYVEGRISALDDYNTNVSSDIDLSGVELDFLSQMTPWASTYMAITYNKSSLPIGPRYNGAVIAISRAFLTIGNLDKSPIYGTIGQIFVPFGSYSSNMIGDSVTKLFAKTKARALEIGFYDKSGIHAEIYAFKGDSDDHGSQEINNAGANLGYKITIGDKFTAIVGAGYLYNIADSMGMQITGGNNNGSFVGFGGSTLYGKTNSEDLTHAVSAGDIYTRLAYGKINSHGEINLTAEYITTLQLFDPSDLMFDGNGAKPSALSIEAAYRFDIINKPAFVSVTYGQTEKALALNLPKESYVGTIGISLWKSTVQKIEYRHELNYGYNDYASGGNRSQLIYTSANRVRNIGMFQIDVYF
jgi:hypothetical protein